MVKTYHIQTPGYRTILKFSTDIDESIIEKFCKQTKSAIIDMQDIPKDSVVVTTSFVGFAAAHVHPNDIDDLEIKLSVLKNLREQLTRMPRSLQAMKGSNVDEIKMKVTEKIADFDRQIADCTDSIKKSMQSADQSN